MDMNGEMRRALAEAAERKLAAEADGPLTAAQRQARYRARRRGEPVPRLRPGPKSRDAKLRARLLELEAENEMLREKVRELEEALERRPSRLRRAPAQPPRRMSEALSYLQQRVWDAEARAEAEAAQARYELRGNSQRG